MDMLQRNKKKKKIILNCSNLTELDFMLKAMENYFSQYICLHHTCYD